MASFLLPGSAIPAHVLSGDSFSAGSNYNVAGTMPNNGALVLTPGASVQAIPAGYHSGSGNVPAVVVPVANVLTGTTIAGQAGTMPENGAIAITPSGASQAIPAGHHNGSGNVAAVSVPVANVLSGTTIAGQAGTYSNIKSRQSGTVGLSASTQTVTIAAVDLTKAIVRISVQTPWNSYPDASYYATSGVLTNATTLTIAVYGGSGDSLNAVWEVIEFNGVKSLQSGSWAISASSQALTISSVNTSKSMIFYSFAASANVGSNYIASILTTLVLTSSTSLTFSQQNATPYIVKWYLVEFY